MLSYVLYGRNDSYGYNLHKRAALSLNCMAEVLSDADDEILFVDYNTPDDFPTFPEAIQDTLTSKAKTHLRILRVRPKVHARFAGKTSLRALEPISRNVAVRRSNPANRWILSTNTDMIFVPRSGRSLTEIVGELPKGYYGIPRFEVPETLWESLDRRDGAGIIKLFERWGWQFHLNDIVYGASHIRFDAPGDFQLIERADLFAYQGFHEEMLRGWHVDSNIAKRLSLVYSEAGDLTDQLFGYHCDHTRQVTPMHRRDADENSMDAFINDVARPDIPGQVDSWGCPNDEIEEICLNNNATGIYVSALEQLLPVPLRDALESFYVSDSYDKCGYVPEHVLPFLLDLFASVPRSLSVAWVGAPGRLLELFSAGWQRLGFTGYLLLDAELKNAIPDSVRADQPWIRWTSPAERNELADAFIFDFARWDGGALPSKGEPGNFFAAMYLLSELDTVLKVERERGAKKIPPRRLIGINAIHNRFDRVFSSYINVSRTPFSVRIRHGYVDQEAISSEMNWLPRMLPGIAGRRVGTEIHSKKGVAGHVVYGPYAYLLPGAYAVQINLRCVAEPEEAAVERNVLPVRRIAGVLGWKTSKRAGVKRSGSERLFVEAVSGDQILSRDVIRPQNEEIVHVLRFDVPPDRSGVRNGDLLEVRVWSDENTDIVIKDVIARFVGETLIDPVTQFQMR